MKSITFIFFIILLAGIQAQENFPVKRIYTAIRTNPQPPVIDGKSYDPVWKSAYCADNFIQYEPQEGTAPSQNTNFRICYD
jgi:hypothetical protein